MQYQKVPYGLIFPMLVVHNFFNDIIFSTFFICYWKHLFFTWVFLKINCSEMTAYLFCSLMNIYTPWRTSCYLLLWYYKVTVLWVKQSPSNRTVMDKNHCCSINSSYNCLATRPETEREKWITLYESNLCMILLLQKFWLETWREDTDHLKDPGTDIRLLLEWTLVK